MMEEAKQWEGQVVDGRFPLLRYAGGGEPSAVFETASDDPQLQKAAIKLTPEDPEDSDAQLTRWLAAGELAHPHLVRLFQMGRCRLDGAELNYLVMDFADEDLSQVLPTRALSAEEVREVLEGTLDALSYLHSHGFVHGRLRPSNILAVGDQLRVSSDRLLRMGESRGGVEDAYDAPETEITPAADVWSLGVTLVEALTQRLPVWDGDGHLESGPLEALPAPFGEIARHCLEPDPRRRWTVAEIRARLGQPVSAPRAEPIRDRRPFATIALVLSFVLVAAVAGPKLLNRHLDPLQPPPVPSLPEESRLEPTPAASHIRGQVVRQVLPDVEPRVMAGIRGTVRVTVKVHVDRAGNVTGAQLASAGPSRHFARLAAEAAQRWKFSPQAAPQDWLLQFEFTSRGAVARSRAVH
jgi:TonB family protein